MLALQLQGHNCIVISELWYMQKCVLVSPQYFTNISLAQIPLQFDRIGSCCSGEAKSRYSRNFVIQV